MKDMNIERDIRHTSSQMVGSCRMNCEDSRLTQDILMEKGNSGRRAIAVYNEAVAEGRVMVAHIPNTCETDRGNCAGGNARSIESAPNI